MSNKTDDLIERGIKLIENELSRLEKTQRKGALDFKATEGLLSMIKTLIAIRSDNRMANKENGLKGQPMSEEEYEAAILAEATAIRKKNE